MKRIPIINGYKHCSKCDRDLPIENFSKAKQTTTGLNSICRTCVRNRTPNYIVVETKRCSKCKQTLPIEMFNRNKQSRTQYGSWCKSCFKKAKISNPLFILLQSAKYRSRKRQLFFDIDIEWLQKRYTGRCELTDIEFQFATEGRSPIAPSLDRIDNTKGYTKDNVRIIIDCLNTAIGQWGEEVYYRVAKAYIKNKND